MNGTTVRGYCREGETADVLTIAGDVNDVYGELREDDDFYLKFSDGTILHCRHAEAMDDGFEDGWRIEALRRGRLFGSADSLLSDDGTSRMDTVRFKPGLTWARLTFTPDVVEPPPADALCVRHSGDADIGIEWNVGTVESSMPFAWFDHEADSMLFAGARHLLAAAEKVIAAWSTNPSSDVVAAIDDLRIADAVIDVVAAIDDLKTAVAAIEEY